MVKFPINAGGVSQAQQLRANAFLKFGETALPGKWHDQLNVQRAVKQRAVM